MATPKTTCRLEPDAVEALDRLAKTWRVSRSDALRRAALVALPPAEPEMSPEAKIEALKQLQASMKLTPAAARRWIREIRAERRGWKPARRRQSE
jgi:predicted transcriptional regulator